MAQWMNFEPDQPSGWTESDFESFVNGGRWIHARTMPHNPHEYALRSASQNAEFDSAVRYIREHGSMEEFGGKPYKVLHLSSNKYWTMGDELHSTILINRKRL